MEPPNPPPGHHSNEYYANPQSSDWWERSNPAESASQNEHDDLGQKQRRNTIQSHVHPVTVPTGQAGRRQFSKQQQQHPEHGADLALRHHRRPGTEQRPRSRTVYDSGRIPAGQSVTTTVPAPISRMRHTRRGSNTTAPVTSPLMNPNPPSSTTSGRVSSSRTRRRDIPDAPRHARRISRSQSVLMAAATTQLSMDTNPTWHSQPAFDGRGMREYPANMMVSETPAGHSMYAYETGRPHLSYPSAPPEAASAGFSAPGIPANSGRLGIGAASTSTYPSRSTIGLAGSLQRSPASTTADRHLDSQVYSHNQHGDHYGHIVPGSQYAQEFDYTHLAQPTHIDSMSANLQRHQHTDAIYTPDPHAQYYHSSHSHSPASPRLPLRSSPQQAIYQSYAAPNLTVNPFTVDDIVKLNQVSYLPPQNHHLQSPLPAVSSPSEMSEPPERHSPTLQSRARVPGQRVDVDGKMLENSFRGNDDQSRVRRQVLNDIQRQSWFHSNQDEPKMDVHIHRDILEHGLGMVGRSIYTVFLVEDKDSNQWRCLFGSEDMSCKKTEKRFERVERAIEHVRSHLGHRPFACDGTCHKTKSTGISCGKRFFAAGYLEDHKKRPQKRANVA